jgi:signal transduction histidine kinase/CheY-like chemotaxis protein
LVLLVVGIGVFFISTRWLIGALLVVYLTWAWAMQAIGAVPADWVHYSFALLSATMLALLAHLARKRLLRRLTLLRLQDQARAERLQAALAAEQQSEARYRQLFEQTQLSLSEAQALYKVSRSIIAQERLPNLLQTVVDKVAEVLPADGVTINLLDLQKRQLTHFVAGGVRPIWGAQATFDQLWSGLTGWVLRELQPALSPKDLVDAREDEQARQQRQASGCGALLVVPIHQRNKALGTLTAINGRDKRDFTQRDVDLLMAMAQQTAIALDNTQLYQELEERAQELHGLNSQLAQAARLKDEFLASMSHELRTPLNAILGLSESLREQIYGTLNERQLTTLDYVMESGRHLLALINDILDVAKIEAGKLTLEPAPVAVVALSQACLAMLHNEATKKRLKVSATYDPAVALISADERRLKQILVNLLGNAVKFTPDGGSIGLEVRGNPEQQSVHFTVWDTGIGIAEGDLDRLFKPFVQLDSRLSRQYAGTGLGLALVYRMAEMHGGSVAVQSQPGRGSRFTITLPWQTNTLPAVPSAAIEAALPTPPIARQAVPSSDLILLADDHELNLTVLTEFLSRVGYRVLTARNGLEALELAQAHRPALLLLDIQMPQLDGLQVLQRLRSDVALRMTPVIAMTALAMPGDRERCLAAGANAYVSKPVSLKSLSTMIQELLRPKPGLVEHGAVPNHNGFVQVKT